MLKSAITPRCSLFAVVLLGTTELGMYLHFGGTDPKPLVLLSTTLISHRMVTSQLTRVTVQGSWHRNLDFC